MKNKTITILHDLGNTLIGLILSFSLMTTFLTKFIELTDKLFPVKGNLTIGPDPHPTYLRFLTSISDIVNSKPAITALLCLTTIIFIYEVVSLINKIRNNVSRKEHGIL